MPPYEKAVVESDDWYTPKYIFDALNETFDLDVASPIGGPRYVPTKHWISDNSLLKEWNGFIWMNPPYGNSKNKCLWLEKFFTHGNGIALMADRTSASWFQKYGPLADCILWVSPKIKFERPDGTIGSSPGTGSVLFASGKRAELALLQSKLGFVTKTIGYK